MHVHHLTNHLLVQESITLTVKDEHALQESVSQIVIVVVNHRTDCLVNESALVRQLSHRPSALNSPVRLKQLF